MQVFRPYDTFRTMSIHDFLPLPVTPVRVTVAKPDTCRDSVAELVHQLFEVSGTGRIRFHHDHQFFGEWFLEDKEDHNDAVAVGVRAITEAASWCRGRTATAMTSDDYDAYVISGAEMYTGKTRRLMGASHVTIQFNFVHKTNPQDTFSTCMSPCSLLRYEPFRRLVREAIADSALVGSSLVSGADSSILRFTRHPLYERNLWWLIFQFLGLASVPCSN